MKLNRLNLFFGIVLIFGMIGVVLAVDPTWNDTAHTTLHYTSEDASYLYNFTEVINDISELLHISILGVTWSEDVTYTQHSNFSWLPWQDTGFSNSTLGMLIFNSSSDNETGNFTFNMFAQGTDGGDANYFEFIINATNDAPNFTSIDYEYNLTMNEVFTSYVNGSDEEEHYPLSFNISFNSSCVHADWSGRNVNENCSLVDFGFAITNSSNLSAIMNFTPSRNDVGTYWANISITDFGENYDCPHIYCDNATYKQNKTQYSAIIKFNVFAALEINASDCQDKIFQENSSGACMINITTKDSIDNLNISSLASVRNYVASVSNSSWFYANNNTNASNFALSVYVNVTPQKTEIGNWTINFTVFDLTSGENLTEHIYVYVNRTSNDVPEITEVQNTNTSMDLLTIIYFNVSDDDLLIPDKLEGFNETSNFTLVILNQSDLGQELSISGFDVDVVSMPVAGTNRTEAKIEFTPDSSDVGDYTINITVNDRDGAKDSTIFNLSILDNSFPVWNQTSYSYNLVVNSTFSTTQSFGAINLSDSYTSDANGDVLTFSNSSSAFQRFNLSSEGLVSFTPWKEDVGYWNFTVTATDPLGLQNSTTFIFNITNTNSEPFISTPLVCSVNCTVESSSNKINATEDDNNTIQLWVYDEDFRILSSKKDYYNESLTLNLTIEGPNPSLFSFVANDLWNPPIGNKTLYDAIFVPNKSDVGDYNITVNITDASNASVVLMFNLTVLWVDHSPDFLNLTNQSSGVNRTLFYDVNVTDREDVDDSSGNIVYNLTFLNGTDFFKGDESIFNTTSGVLNITFNSSQAGAYQINLTANDSSGLMNSIIWWVYVYDASNITYPGVGYNFSLQEGIQSNLTFQVNHSVQDNLTCEFYLNSYLKHNISYYGNTSNLTWSFIPNYTEETYGEFVNLTLFVYPTNPLLINASEFNYSRTWNANITHSNAPVNFSGYMRDEQSTHNLDITINLTEYFSDSDYFDVHYNQTVNFTISSNATNTSLISYSVSDWILTLSSSSVAIELIIVNGTDLNSSNDSLTSSVSNSFEVEFTEPAPTPTPTPSSGGGSSEPEIVSLEIIMPEPVSVYVGQRISLPVILRNSGERNLDDIDLSTSITSSLEFSGSLGVSLDKSFIDSLGVGESEELIMTLDINTVSNGTFEITLNASVDNPDYNDYGKLYLTVKESDEGIRDKLIFTQEFLQENPECIELEEILKEAEEYFRQGDFVNTVMKINEAIDGCKNAISQQARLKRKEPQENLLYRYLFIGTIVVFILGLVFYSYRRMRMKRSYVEDDFVEEVKKPVAVLISVLALGAVLFFNQGMTGFAVGSGREEVNWILLIVTGVVLVVGFLFRKRIFLFFKKKNQLKNKISGLRKKKVYTSEGDYLGRVEEAIIGRKKIEGIRVKLFKRGVKGVVIKYKDVESVGEVVIVNKKINQYI